MCLKLFKKVKKKNPSYLLSLHQRNNTYKNRNTTTNYNTDLKKNKSPTLLKKVLQ